MQKMKLTILDKLHKIEDKEIIYNIHYCAAGVGFIFYDETKIQNPIPGIVEIAGKKVNTEMPENWREGLFVTRYYGAFEEAVKAEYDKLCKN